MSLEIENLHVRIDEREILHGVDLTVGRGETHALMGPNGSGKSTLANTIMGNPKYEVTEGRMRFKVGLRTVMAGPGDVVEVEPGVSHSFANAGDEEARLRVEVRPALAMEDMFAEVIAMAQAGRMNDRGMPRNLLDLALLARTYDQEAHAPFLGVRMQRILLAPLVWFGRRRSACRAAASVAH